MKKSEIIANAIAKIEALRPSVDSFLNAYLDSGLDCGFSNSEFSNQFDEAFASWYEHHKSFESHLVTALSVARADEYLECQQCN